MDFMLKIMVAFFTVFGGVAFAQEMAEAVSASTDPVLLDQAVGAVQGVFTSTGPEKVVAIGILINILLKWLASPKGLELLKKVPDTVEVKGWAVPVRGMVPFAAGLLAFVGDALMNGGGLGMAVVNGLSSGLLAKGVHVFVKGDLNGKAIGGSGAAKIEQGLAQAVEEMAETPDLPEARDAAEEIVKASPEVKKVVEKAKAAAKARKPRSKKVDKKG